MKLIAVLVLFAACGDDGGGETLADAAVINDASRLACTGDLPAAEGAACDSECADSDIPLGFGEPACTARYVHAGQEYSRQCRDDVVFTANGRMGCCFMETSGGAVVHFAVCD